MSRDFADIQRRCDDAQYSLQSGWKSRQDMWEIRAVLRSIATDLDWEVRDWLAESPESIDGRRAKASLGALQSTLHWLEDNPFGLMRFEIHRILLHAQRHALELLTVFKNAAAKKQIATRWDGVDRRSGADRRVIANRRTTLRSPVDRRCVDRRDADHRLYARRAAAG
ncbi:MAG: hypothetical protein NVS2B16_00920 [Chloroflexota bacterium]